MNVTAFLIALMAFLAVMLLFPVWLRHRSEAAKLRFIGDALDKGHTVDPTLLDRLTHRRPPVLGKWYAVLCFLMSFVSLGAGVGLLVAGQSVSGGLNEQTGPGALMGGIIITAVGIGYLVLGLTSLRFFTGRAGPALRLTAASALALICLFVGVAAFASGVGLATALPFIAEVSDPDGGTRAGMRVGALMNLGPGIGFLALGVTVLWLFRDSEDG